MKNKDSTVVDSTTMNILSKNNYNPKLKSTLINIENDIIEYANNGEFDYRFKVKNSTYLKDITLHFTKLGFRVSYHRNNFLQIDQSDELTE